MNELDRIQEILLRYRAMRDERSLLEPEWLNCRDYCYPWRGFFNDQKPDQGTPGNSAKIYDSTATIAVQRLASGLHSGLTSPTRPWFRLGMDDGSAKVSHQARAYLDFVEKAISTALARSNFYPTAHQFYLELACFGPAVIFVDEDDDKFFRARNPTVGTYWCATDQHGRVDTVYLLRWMTSRQIQHAFPNAVPREVETALRENRLFDRHQVLYVVQPRQDRDFKDKSATGLPWESLAIYIDGEAKLLREAGYAEQPMMVGRWSVTGDDTYGVGPVAMVMRDIMGSHSVTKTAVLALHKQADPPLRVPAQFAKRVNATPGGLTLVDPNETASLGALYEVKPDANGTLAYLQDLRNAIKQGLYNDLFLLMAQNKANMTATEVMERHEEKLLMLGPVIERLHAEVFDPLIERVFQILYRAGQIPPPPQSVANLPVKIEYISVLAQAQKLVATKSITSVSSFIASHVQLVPEIIDLLDADTAAREYADATGAPSSILRSAEAVEAIRKQRAQAQAQAQQQAAQQIALDQAVQTADMGRTLSETAYRENTALEGVRQALTGGA